MRNWVACLAALSMAFPCTLVGQIANPKDPFSQSKVRINFLNLQNSGDLAASSRLAQKASEVQLPAGMELVGIFDSACLESIPGKAAGDLTNQVLNGRPVTKSELHAEALILTSPTNLRQLSDSAEADACVVGLVENIRFQKTGFNDDPLFNQQTHLPAIGAPASHDLFWDSSFAINRDVTIAVIDTGVQYNHPDLTNRMWQNADGEFGYNFVEETGQPMDDNGHGTHVAGLIGAQSSNNVGVSGVMGFRGKIMAVKVLDADGGGNLTDVINGINYAVDNGAEILNLSLAGQGANAGIELAVNRAVQRGAVVLAAAGNEGVQLSNSNVFSPASYGAALAGMLTVGAVDALTLRRSSFSNFSPMFVEIAAPGSSGDNGIVSTYNMNLYAGLDGTSMATPITAGAVGLTIGFLKTHNIPYTPMVVEEILLGGSIRDASLTSAFQNGNRLNLNQLARYLASRYLFSGNSGLEDNL